MAARRARGGGLASGSAVQGLDRRHSALIRLRRPGPAPGFQIVWESVRRRLLQGRRPGSGLGLDTQAHHLRQRVRGSAAGRGRRPGPGACALPGFAESAGRGLWATSMAAVTARVAQGRHAGPGLAGLKITFGTVSLRAAAHRPASAGKPGRGRAGPGHRDRDRNPTADRDPDRRSASSWLSRPPRPRPLAVRAGGSARVGTAMKPV